MKMKTFKIISLVLLLCCIFIFAGCSGNNAKEQESTGKTEETTVSQTANDNPLIGTWQLVDDNSKNHTLFSYIIQDEKTILMAMGNVAYYSELKLDKNESGKNTLTAQLYYNVNGTYVYEISDDGKTMTLIKENDKKDEKLVLGKVEDYKFMPDPPENPKIDERLIGKWKDKEGSGNTYIFNENGTMENSIYKIMITYAQYSADDGEINCTYNLGTEVNDVYKYSFEGDVLIIDGVEFVKQ